MIENENRYCDRCGVLLTKDNNKCGYELCDECNEWLEEYMRTVRAKNKRKADKETILHTPLTKEDWNKISDLEHEDTEFVTFQTPQGRRVKYVKYDVLDKIKEEIQAKYGNCDICEYFENYDYEENDISEYRVVGGIADILQIIDKYGGL